MPTIGEIVAACRTAAGLTREQVVGLSGLSAGYLADLENDRFTSLTFDTFKALRLAMPKLSCEAIVAAMPPEKRTVPKRSRGRPKKPAPDPPEAKGKT